MVLPAVSRDVQPLLRALRVLSHVSGAPREVPGLCLVSLKLYSVPTSDVLNPCVIEGIPLLENEQCCLGKCCLGAPAPLPSKVSFTSLRYSGYDFTLDIIT